MTEEIVKGKYGNFKVELLAGAIPFLIYILGDYVLFPAVKDYLKKMHKIDPEGNMVRLQFFVFLLLCVLLLMSTFFVAWIIYIGIRTIRVGVSPFPGQLVLTDTVLLRGQAARRKGMQYLFVAIVVAIFCTWAILNIYRLFNIEKLIGV